MKKGKVYIMGGGGGDRELLTLKAMRRLQAADVILYDYLSNPALLKYAQAGAELIAGDLRGKRFSDSSIINQTFI